MRIATTEVKREKKPIQTEPSSEAVPIVQRRNVQLPVSLPFLIPGNNASRFKVLSSHWPTPNVFQRKGYDEHSFSNNTESACHRNASPLVKVKTRWLAGKSSRLPPPRLGESGRCRKTPVEMPLIGVGALCYQPVLFLAGRP